MVARTSMFFAKLSILLLYIRLFFPKGVQRSLFWWIIQAVVWLNFLYTVGLILAIALQCVPYHKPYGSSCINQYMVLISASIINIISDLLVLLIPMASVWRLNMSRKRKWAVWALFAFGCVPSFVAFFFFFFFCLLLPTPFNCYEAHITQAYIILLVIHRLYQKKKKDENTK